MRDEAHEWTDEQIAALVERIRLTYRSAQIDVQGKLDQFIRKFKRDEAKFREKLEKGEITQEDADRIYEEMMSKLASIANRTAASSAKPDARIQTTSTASW